MLDWRPGVAMAVSFTAGVAVVLALVALAHHVVGAR
jgi:hypothetical protein